MDSSKKISRILAKIASALLMLGGVIGLLVITVFSRFLLVLSLYTLGEGGLFSSSFGIFSCLFHVGCSIGAWYLLKIHEHDERKAGIGWVGIGLLLLFFGFTTNMLPGALLLGAGGICLYNQYYK